MYAHKFTILTKMLLIVNTFQVCMYVYVCIHKYTSFLNLSKVTMVALMIRIQAGLCFGVIRLMALLRYKGVQMDQVFLVLFNGYLKLFLAFDQALLHGCVRTQDGTAQIFLIVSLSNLEALNRRFAIGSQPFSNVTSPSHYRQCLGSLCLQICHWIHSCSKQKLLQQAF